MRQRSQRFVRQKMLGIHATRKKYRLREVAFYGSDSAILSGSLRRPPRCSPADHGVRRGTLDPDDPGAGTSSGNAGTIADYGCVPVNMFGLNNMSPEAVEFIKARPLDTPISRTQKSASA